MKRRSLVREAPMTNGPIADALAHLGPGAVKQAKKLFENKGDTMTIHTRKREESVERRCEGTEDVVLTITGAAGAVPGDDLGGGAPSPNVFEDDRRERHTGSRHRD